MTGLYLIPIYHIENMVFKKLPFVSHSHAGLEQGKVEYMVTGYYFILRELSV